MAKIEVTECDSCGYVQTEDGDSTGIFSCQVCDEDICDDCQDEHAKEECFP